MGDATPAAETLRERLWISRRPFQRRLERSAAALVAIRHTLASHRPLDGGEDEFLALYDRVEALDPESFTTMWKAPQTFAWVLSTYETLGRHLAGAGRSAELKSRLDGFKALALGAHVTAQRQLHFDDPLAVELPFAVPGTRGIAMGRGPAAVRGYEPPGLRIERDGGCLLVALEPAPEVEYAGCRIQLNPYTLRGPGLEFSEAGAAIDFGLERHAESRPQIRDALRVMREHAGDAFEQFRDVIESIALKDASDESFSNMSRSDLPGSFVVQLVADRHVLADAFIHELHHNRMSVLEDESPILEPHGDDTAQHYSPWREDPRTLHGTLHAVYVFVPVLRFWMELLQARNASGDLAAYALDRVLRIPLQLELGIRVVERNASFAPDGRALFEEMKLTARELAAEIHGSGYPDDAPAWYYSADGYFKRETSTRDGRLLRVEESVREHADRFDLRGETKTSESR